MSDRARIQDRIAKLMAMAGDGRGNEHEAAAALRMAQSLMMKHGIEFAEVVRKTGRIPGFEWVDKFVPTSDEGGIRRAPQWQHFIAAELSRFTETHVDLVQSPTHVGFQFGGVYQDVEYAAYLMRMLIDAGERAALRREVGRRGRDQIRMGFSLMICARLIALKDETDVVMASNENALVVINSKKKMIEAKYGKPDFIEAEGLQPESVLDGMYQAFGAQLAHEVGLGRPMGEK